MLNWEFDESKKMIFLHGRIDAQTSVLLEKELNNNIIKGHRQILINCSDIDY
ncbi:MAG: hypothetical protein HQK78_19135, partial [Desulfobacterales bacterium]|nr:hypothetical protein [Desulfobacterales bacterium]